MILDSEVLLIDNKTGKPLPFGTLGVHKVKNKIASFVVIEGIILLTNMPACNLLSQDNLGDVVLIRAFGEKIRSLRRPILMKRCCSIMIDLILIESLGGQ